MSPEPDLWDDVWRQVRTSDPATSHEAARRNADGLMRQRDNVEVALNALGPAGGTSYAVAQYMTERMGIPTSHVQAGRRLFELGDLQPARATVRGKGRSPQGDACRIWVSACYRENAA